MNPQLDLDLDPHFEPQQRARSNTWPLPRPENYVDIKEEPDVVEGICGNDLLNGDPAKNPDSATAPKKNSSRRNAWGNMSYADLITQAIQSSADNRLTLSQIYDWMVQNVPYFKDKGDSNSSAGWKNSIRHNLSLHNRFVRVQNEGTGKSSWWMINPDAKPGKSARRRATSMETSKYEKKRGRVKKKVEALRAGLTTTPSPSSSVSEGLDMFPESPQIIHPHFQLSPGDFRPRASSNASSIAGRLSPIPAVGLESELQEGTWSPDYAAGLYHPGLPPPGAGPSSQQPRYSADQLVDNIAESMKIRENGYLGSVLSQNGYSLCHPVLGNNPYAPTTAYQGHTPDYRMPPPPTHPTMQQQPINRSPQMTPAPPPYALTTLQGLSPSYSAELGNGFSSLQHQAGCSSGSSSSVNSSSTEGCNLLRAALAQGSNNSPLSSPENPTPSQMMSQLMGALNNNGPMPNDLDLNLDSLQGGFDCNVDEVIKHELSMDGTLDFNFSSSQHHHQQHLQQQQQPHLPPANDFLFGPTPSTLLAGGDRATPTSQTLCSLAMGAPGRSWVR